MIRIPLLTSALLAVSLAAPATAQLQVFGGEAPRMASTRIFWNDGPVGMVCVQYGQPEWKDDYEAMMGQLVGKQLRLGKDFWTTLNTTNPMTIGRTKVLAGSYYLGLKCDEDGGFHLLVMRAEKADKMGWAPFVADAWKADYTIAMKMGKAEESAEKMMIALGGGAKDPTALELSVAWGKHVVTVPATFHLGEGAVEEQVVEEVVEAVEATPASGTKKK